MDINVKVKVEMPGVMESLLALAEAFEGYRKDCLGSGIDDSRILEVEKVREESLKEMPVNILSEALGKIEKDILKEALKSVNKDVLREVLREGEVSLEEVRSVLSRVYRSGKKLEVCNIFKDLGYEKLIDVPKNFYPIMIEMAEDLERRVA
ncbi:MAG: hypothetical protein ACRC28_09600 [Clostridium sp.]|uniref:hypothetical protein n=1 Tax=Clostridium sp. TaxID=1506 RepID=UPI003F3D2CDA